jgi:acetyl esterase/lipase
MRAMKIIRKNAFDWNLNIEQIGVMGFSAGGHLASTLGTHSENISYNVSDEIDKEKSYPDFMALIYPVISMVQSFSHIGSRNNLLGNNPSEKLKEFYSNEKYVDKKTPPTFLVHSSDDNIVSVENSIVFYNELQKYGINSELHVFQNGEHGFSLANSDDNLNVWKSLCINWIRKQYMNQ